MGTEIIPSFLSMHVLYVHSLVQTNKDAFFAPIFKRNDVHDVWVIRNDFQTSLYSVKNTIVTKDSFFQKKPVYAFSDDFQFFPFLSILRTFPQEFWHPLFTDFLKEINYLCEMTPKTIAHAICLTNFFCHQRKAGGMMKK